MKFQNVFEHKMPLKKKVIVISFNISVAQALAVHRVKNVNPDLIAL